MEIALIPRFLLGRIVSDPQRRYHANVLLSSLCVLLIFVVLATHPGASGVVPHVCLCREIFGVPCPGCGIMRSMGASAAGDFHAAFRHNPIGPLFFCFLAIQLPLRLAAIARVALSRSLSRFSRILGALVVAGLMLCWGVRLSC